MKLQTQIPISRADNQIDYTSQLLLLGSCFSENIGQKFEYFKFRSLQNPFGILFHPLAIENLVSSAINNRKYIEADVFYENERWHCFDAHSGLSNTSKGKLLLALNESLERTNQQISKATHIIITLGTAWIYRNLKTDMVVANCHKIPQKEFKKELLSVELIVQSLENVINQVHSINNKAQIIFTVSPVRHLKDGFIENQQSKAHLITSIHRLMSPPAGSRGLSYFASYEIMMDELRDYRFYETDMLHPNSLAIEVIWEKFKETWIAEEAYAIMEKVDEVQKGIRHRPFNPDSEQHKKFIKSLQNKMAYIKDKHSFIDFV